MFRAQWNSFGVPDQQLDSLQHTTEYKQAYDLISDALGKISKQAAAQTCAAGVTSR
jgi:hypothetical protein